MAPMLHPTHSVLPLSMALTLSFIVWHSGVLVVSASDNAESWRSYLHNIEQHFSNAINSHRWLQTSTSSNISSSSTTISNSTASVSDDQVTYCNQRIENLPTLFSSTLTLSIDSWAPDTVLNVSTLNQMGEYVQDIYNTLNSNTSVYIQDSSNSTNCDPVKRRIESITVISEQQLLPTQNADGGILILYQATASCMDCHQSDIDLFDSKNELAYYANVLQNHSFTSTPLSCNCLDPIVSTIEQVHFQSPTIQQVSQILHDKLLQEGVILESSSVAVQEINPILTTDSTTCGPTNSTTPTVFHKLILVDIQLACFVIDDDLAVFEDGLVYLYNALAETRFCDPHVKRLLSATVSRQGVEDFEQNRQTLEILVTGTCQGCNVSDFLFFDFPQVNERPQASFSLEEFTENTTSPFLEVGDECYCDSNATPGRGPSEPEFVAAFQHYLETGSIQDSLACISSLGQCEFTPFETAILVLFQPTNNFEEFAEEAGQILKGSFNTLLTSNQAICETEFRVVQDVEPVLGVDLNDEFLGGRRFLQGDIPQTIVLPSMAPSTWQMANDTMSPTQAPTYDYAGSLLGLFFVTGVCTGCSTDSLLGSQLTGEERRNLQQSFVDDPLMLMEQGRRELQFLDENPESKCVCPITAVVQDAGIDNDELIRQFQGDLLNHEIPLTINAVDEVTAVECDDEVVSFNTTFELEFMATTSEITTDGIAALPAIVKESYNALSSDYCDPLIRRIHQIELAPVVLQDSSLDCQLVQLRFEVQGDCRGCANGTSMLDIAEVDFTDHITRRIEELSSAVSQSIPSNRPRRRMQDSDYCFCVEETVAERAPSLGEFANVLTTAIENQGITGICRVVGEHTSQPSSAPSLYPSGAPTPCEAELKNEFYSYMLVWLEDGSDLTESDVSDLALSLVRASTITVYNEFSECDAGFRKLDDAAPQLSYGDRRLSVLSSPYSQNHRAMQIDTTNTVPFSVNGSCTDCLSTTRFFDSVPIVPFVDHLRQVSSVGSNRIVTVQEVESMNCSGPELEFSRTVIVDLEFTCFQALQLGDAVLGQLANLFVTSYNNLASDFCDYEFRTLSTAQVVTVGNVNEFGVLPVEIMVTGHCIGCDPSTVELYGIPEGDALNTTDGRRLEIEEFSDDDSYRRKLILRNGDLCYCDVQKIARRAPYESEVMDEFRRSVELLDHSCVESVGECLFGTSYDSDIMAIFDFANITEIEEKQDIVEETFRRVLAELYANDGETCNQDFRQIDSVVAQLDFTWNGDFIQQQIQLSRHLEAGVPSSGTRQRKIQATTSVPTLNPTSLHGNISDASSVSPSPSYSLAPSNSSAPSASPSLSSAPSLSTAPSSYPTYETKFKLILSVGGVCNGCSNDLILSDQLSSRALRGSNIQPFKSAGFSSPLMSFFGPRQTQESQIQESNATSNCFCQLSAAINNDPPSAQVVLERWQEELNKEGVNAVLNEVRQVTSVECTEPDSTHDFSEQFFFPFSATDDVTDAEIRQLGKLIEEEYNSMVDLYCDPLIRKDLRLILVNKTLSSSTTQLQEGCTNFIAQFSAVGSCRGCDSNQTTVLDLDFGDGRRQLEDITGQASILDRKPPSRRRLADVAESKCYCDGQTVASRAPSLVELATNVEARIPGASFVGICDYLISSEVICDLPPVGEGVLTSLTLGVRVPGGMVVTDTLLTSIETTFRTSFNTAYKEQYHSCDEAYVQALWVRIDRSILDFLDRDPSRQVGGNVYTMAFDMELSSGSIQDTFFSTFRFGGRAVTEIPSSVFTHVEVVNNVEILGFGTFTNEPSMAPSAWSPGQPGAPFNAPSQPTDIGAPLASPALLPSLIDVPSLTPVVPPTPPLIDVPSLTPILPPAPPLIDVPSLSPIVPPTPPLGIVPSMTPVVLPAPSIVDVPSLTPVVSPSTASLPTGLPLDGPSLQVTSPPLLPTSLDTVAPAPSPNDSPSQSGGQPSIVATTTPVGLAPALSGGSVQTMIPSISPSQLDPSKVVPPSSPMLTPTVSPLATVGTSNSPTRTLMPTETMSLIPSFAPSKAEVPPNQLSGQPIAVDNPTLQPTTFTASPHQSSSPSEQINPSNQASGVPSFLPSAEHSTAPPLVLSNSPSTHSPTTAPPSAPSAPQIPGTPLTTQPVLTDAPTKATSSPIVTPSMVPLITTAPSTVPFAIPAPSVGTNTPQLSPSPSSMPSAAPGVIVIVSPSPTLTHSSIPSFAPAPSNEPTIHPTFGSPTAVLSSIPTTTLGGIGGGSSAPSVSSSAVPSVATVSSTMPTSIPTNSLVGSSAPSVSSSAVPSVATVSSAIPSSVPTDTLGGSSAPSSSSSAVPSVAIASSVIPSSIPTESLGGSTAPSVSSSDVPSVATVSSAIPSSIPTVTLGEIVGSSGPSVASSAVPSIATVPSSGPSSLPTMPSTSGPTALSSTSEPSSIPTILAPTAEPSTFDPTFAPTTGDPSGLPTITEPSAGPSTLDPTAVPTTGLPSTVPTSLSSGLPTEIPTTAPISLPTDSPTLTPVSLPTEFPTTQPTDPPTVAPVSLPTEVPTSSPTPQLTDTPTVAPTELPTKTPTSTPTKLPTEPPTLLPTSDPTSTPTAVPTKQPTITPTSVPTKQPTRLPTDSPTAAPTKYPTDPPTALPTENPTDPPTVAPTKQPTDPPTSAPTKQPTDLPTETPTRQPTDPPTMAPTRLPTDSPTAAPTDRPTDPPTAAPTRNPTEPPTVVPTKQPTDLPTAAPTKQPTESPTKTPTKHPTDSPTAAPTKQPTESPTKTPTKHPTDSPTAAPTKQPTESPTKTPTKHPTDSPTAAPTKQPTDSPTRTPTKQPTKVPTMAPTNQPTMAPTYPPTCFITIDLLIINICL